MKDCAGTIAPGGDKHAYLGHFRNPKNLERGHNLGMPPTTGGLGEGGVPGGPTVESPGLMTPKPAPAPAAGLATPAAPKLAAPRGAPGLAAPKVAMPKVQKPTFNPVTNPIAATRQANRAALASAKSTGGPLGAVRAENKAALKTAIGERRSRNEAGFQAADTAALKAARRGVTASPATAVKAKLRSAVGAVRKVRTGIRNSLRGATL